MVLVEVCVDSLGSALAAFAAGAQRIELCSALASGGTTPSIGLLKVVLARVLEANSAAQVFVMARPRDGDFLYDELEKEVLLADVRAAKSHGAHGIVTGVLTKKGHVDVEFMKKVVQAAAPLPVTFHRAIDVAQDPFKAIAACSQAGVRRILTSGGKPSAMEGAPLIKAMMPLAASLGVVVIAGSGVNETNVAKLVECTGCTEVHGTFRKTVNSSMEYWTNPILYMGSIQDPAAEKTRKVADKETIAKVMKKVSRCGKE